MFKKKFEKRILFAGMPDMALECLDRLILEGINIIGVIIPPKTDAGFIPFLDTVKKNGLNIISYKESLSEPDFLGKISELKPDLGVCASFSSKFPQALLNIPKDGFINLHPSKLPDYRGSNPYSHVIINNEKKSAVTLHFMDENFDTGNIISQYEFDIEPDETMGSLFQKTNQICAAMLFEALNYYETNRFKSRRQGVCSKYAYTLSFQKRNIFIDWSRSAEDIERFIRALNPFIGAFTAYNGIYLRINSARVIKQKHKSRFGSIYDVQDGLIAACGEDLLEINSLQYGALYITDGKDFVKRIKPKKGKMFYNG